MVKGMATELKLGPMAINMSENTKMTIEMGKEHLLIPMEINMSESTKTAI